MNDSSSLLSRLVAGLSKQGEPHPAMIEASSQASNQESPSAVSDAELAILLSAARVAPSADNAQIWRFVTVRDPQVRRRLGEAAGEALAAVFATAPVVIVACGVRFLVTRTRKEQPFAMIDVPIALLHLLLQAQEMGIFCSWTLAFDAAKARSALGIPDDARVVAMAAIGRGPGSGES